MQNIDARGIIEQNLKIRPGSSGSVKRWLTIMVSKDSLPISITYVAMWHVGGSGDERFLIYCAPTWGLHL